MDKLTIYMGQDMDGVIFQMPLQDRDALKKEFPNAMPARRVVVDYGIGYDENAVRSKLKSFIVPALTGLDWESISRILHVVFFDPLENKEVFSL